MSAGGEGASRQVALTALEAICEDESVRAVSPDTVVRAAQVLLQEARWDAEERSDAQWRQELLLDAVEAAQAAAREQVLQMRGPAPRRPLD